MRFILSYPEIGGLEADLLDAGAPAELAATAENAGWDGFAFTEHPVPGARWLAGGGHQTLDPFVALGAVAAATRSLTLFTYLTVVPYRNPFLLAKAAATLDRLSGGRFVLGAGTGYLKSEFFALGVDFDERNALFDEALYVLPLAWSGEPFSYQGRHFQARDAVCLPRPSAARVPLWIGGNAKVTLRRVAEHADGWMPLLGPAEMAATTRTPHLDSVEQIAERVALLRQYAGERFGQLEIAVPYYDRDPDLLGDVERRRDTFGRLAEIGVGWVAVTAPWSPDPGPAEFAEAFAGTYFS